jgi:hypothetical protein
MTYKLLFNRAAVKDFKIKQINVKTAFLNSFINTEIYIEQPEDFENLNYLADK